MNYSTSLEHIIGSSYSSNSYSKISYFSKNVEDNYEFIREEPIIFFEPQYSKKTQIRQYKSQQQYSISYQTNHEFTPEIFLNSSRPKARFIVDNSEAIIIAEEVFELMVKEKLPSNISINVLPFDDFKALHSSFGSWSNGILGFSLNGDDKKIFVRENRLDALMLVVGHEIGHVLTETLPNKHDEEAKAFAFSIEWAKTIKKHNVANLGLSIKDDIDFQPARNGLHDVAFDFVDFMVKMGRNAIEIHGDLVRRYISLLNLFYPR